MPLAPIDGLLLLLGTPGGRYPMDRVRVMKGMFLLAQEGPAQFRNLYRFEPYRFGPFDKTIYQHLDYLRSRDMIRSERNAATGQIEYELTPLGKEQYERLVQSLDSPAERELARIKSFVTTFPFVTLLKQVYAKYPTYAVRSDLRR